MPAGFWLGLFVIPAVAVAVAIVAVAAFAVIWAQAKWGEDYKLKPRKLDDGRHFLASIVACAKWCRYLWVPGWHIVICRTTLATRHSSELDEAHRKVQRAVHDALR